MAGLREFMPGQVWFYYNPNATKALEQKKELGSCTSRPVVIVQAAFYPEWNDIVTVCPMTSSDRRSGVYIDSTILKDGSLIEGGTVLPYLFYNIRTKYLYPVIASNHKRKLLSLSDEDFAKVKHGFLYHFGVRNDPPDYVENWKHLNDFDRNIVIQDVKLAIHSWEERGLEAGRSPSMPIPSSTKRGKPNPVLIQEPNDDPHVENHILASLSTYDREKGALYEEGSEFNPISISHIEEDDSIDEPTKVLSKDVTKKISITYMNMTALEFATKLHDTIGGVYPVNQDSKIYPGSEVLKDASLKDMPSMLSEYDLMKVLNMSISDVMSNTGIQSKATASRFRRDLRQLDWGKDIVYDEVSNMVVFNQNDAKESFSYTGTIPFVKSRSKRNAKRRMILFQIPKEDLKSLLALSNEKLMKTLNLPQSYASSFREDANLLYPNLEIDITPPSDYDDIDEGNNTEEESSEDEVSDTNKILDQVKTGIFSISTGDLETKFPEDFIEERYLYPFYKTLSNEEVQEIAFTSKRNIDNIARNYGVNKNRAKTLYNICCGAMASNKKAAAKGALTINPSVNEEGCMKLILGKYNEITKEEMLAFCRASADEISRIYGKLKLSTTPSKGDIRRAKIFIRKFIAKI